MQHYELECGRVYRGPTRRVEALSKLHIRKCKICQQTTNIATQVTEYDKPIMADAHVEKSFDLQTRLRNTLTNNLKDKEFMEELADMCQRDMFQYPLKWNSTKKKNQRIASISRFICRVERL
jgi:hypothetical protein